MGYGLLRALPGERLFCHRRLREASLLSDLAPAPRRPNHTTSPSAKGTYVSSALRVHRISPRVRDVANAPWVDEMRGVMGVIWVAREAEYFLRRGWTGFTDLPVRANWSQSASGNLRLCRRQITPQPVARMSEATCGNGTASRDPDIAALIRATITAGKSPSSTARRRPAARSWKALAAPIHRTARAR
jgi:hypothetical protein